MRRFLAVVALVTACGSRGGAPARPLPTRTPYLMLFEQGRTWTLTSKDGPVTCKVTEVKRVGDASVSHLTCGDLLVSGTWVAAPAGLYHPYVPVDEPDELTLLGDDDLLLAAMPAERTHEHVLEGGAQDAIDAFGFAGSWCVRQTTESAGDRRSYTLCFDGKDITGGTEDTKSGSETRHVQFGASPPDEPAETD